MPNNHVRRRHAGCLQELMEFFGENFAGARLRTGIAVAKAGAVIGTNTRNLRDLRLHLAPGKICVAQTRVEYDRGSSVTDAVDMHLASAHVNEFSFHRIEAAIPGFGDVFVEKSRGSRKEKEDERTNEHTP